MLVIIIDIFYVWTISVWYLIINIYLNFQVIGEF
jgi:hypothetical protein